MTDALILILTGVVAAFLNTAASSGSAISLPIMIMIGVGPVVANASNRLPIVIGCATAVWTFHRAGHLPWRDAVRFAIPVAIGAVAGALLASVFDDRRTTNLVIFAVVVAVLLLFSNPSKWLSADRTNQPPNKGPLVMILMGCVGVWAGLIAVDSGTYALAVLVLVAKFPIREANAIKVTTLGIAALVSLIVFSGNGDIDWRVAADERWKMRLSGSSINYTALPIEKACERLAAVGPSPFEIRQVDQLYQPGHERRRHALQIRLAVDLVD